VENTSRPQDLAQIMEHLAVNHRDTTTDLVAVANWKVVSHDAARLLARMGAHLVHSAPSTGVRDWSDLRIAVAAGIWLAAARPGDAMEIVSDDRAFDAVGDVAASLGIAFRRLSYRRLGRGEGAEPAPPEPRHAPGREPRRPRRRGGRGRPGRPGPARPGHPAVPGPAPSIVHTMPSAPPDDTGPHTAPHDEIVAVVRALVEGSATGTTNLDALTNALKARGFRRPPGSPRLVTRLRRIRELVVSPRGAISLAAAPLEAPPPEAPEEPVEAAPLAGPAPAAETGGAGRRRRRRRRRGGRGRAAPSAPPA
jgi:hypothetical protein